jgi:hypothetical protein
MPDFARAEISTASEDLTEYKRFVRSLKVGQVVTLPLETGATSRRVMRSLNSAAQESSVRLGRLPSDNGAVRFKVLPEEKRQVNISEEGKRARVEKAMATRAARRQAP